MYSESGSLDESKKAGSELEGCIIISILMHTETRKIFENFSWMLLGQVAGRVFGFFAIIFLARRLGKSAYGMWAFAFALLSYGMLLTDFGLSTYGLIEVSKDRKALKTLLGDILSIRLVIAFFLLIIIVPFSRIVPKLSSMSGLLFLTFLNLIPFALSLDWAFRALEDMKFAALWTFIFNLLFFLLIIIVVKSPSDILKVPSSRFFSLLIASGLLIYLLWKKYPELFAFNVNFSRWPAMMKVSVVLTASFVMIKIYYNIDVLMLGFYRTMKEVGVYSAIYNFVLALSVVRFSLLYAVQPTLSRIEQIPWKDYSKKLWKFEAVSIAIGILLYLFVFVLAGPIIKIFYGGKYTSPETIKLLRILINANLIMFINLVFPSLLIIVKREMLYFWVTTAGATTNFLLNLYLIPRFGYFGAAYTTVLSEFVVFLLSFVLYYRLIRP